MINTTLPWGGGGKCNPTGDDLEKWTVFQVVRKHLAWNNNTRW